MAGTTMVGTVIRKHTRTLLLPALIQAYAGCASGGGAPLYLGPSGASGGSAAVASSLDLARADLEAAREAMDRTEREKAKNRLRRAEQTLREALEADPHSREAAVMLGEALLRRGELGDKGALERCARHLEQVMAVDPDAVEGARHLAHAYARLDRADRVSYWAAYVGSVTDDPGLAGEMAALRRPFQEEFLSSWYEYEGYYESKDALVQEMQPNFQVVTLFQVTPEWERQLAARSLQQLTPSLRLSQDEETRSYLQTLVDRLVAKTPGPAFPYEVQLVESEEVNALALPGKVLVNRGLLAFAESEAELVAVLSHELAHIYAHHGARQFVADFRRQQVAGALLAGLKEAAELDAGWEAQLLDLGAAVTLELIERGYSRGQEKEADRYGTHIAFNAGYNPTFMSSFFVRLYEANPKQPWKLLSTHPPTTERIEYTTRYLEAFPLDVEMQVDSEEFQAMKSRLR